VTTCRDGCLLDEGKLVEQRTASTEREGEEKTGVAVRLPEARTIFGA